MRWLCFSGGGGGGAFGFFNGLRNLVGSKTLTREDIQPVLDKMRDHLIGTLLSFSFFFDSNH